jgi:hypothetical protein
MNSKFQILLMTAALAIVGVSLASLYGGDVTTSAATAASSDPTTAPDLPAVEAPAVAAPQVSAPPASPTKPIPSTAPRAGASFLVKEKTPPVQVKVYVLKYADAETLAEMLRAALQQGKGAITIVPDQRTNQLVATGGAEDLAVAEALIVKLDVAAPERPVANDPARRKPGAEPSYRSPGSLMPAPAGVPGQPQMPPGAPGNFSAGGGGFGGGAKSGGGGGFGAFGGNLGGGGGGAGSARGGFAGGGFGGQFGSGGGASSGWAIALPNTEAVEKQLHEAEAAAKQADELAKKYSDLLKQHEAFANSTGESGELYKQFHNLVDDQRRSAEDDRRKVDDYRRQLAEAKRAAERGLQLWGTQSGAGESKEINSMLKRLEDRALQLIKQSEVAQASGNKDQITSVTKEMDEVKATIKNLVEFQNDLEPKKAVWGEQSDKIDQQIRELLGAYQKSATTEKPNEEQQKKLDALKRQLRELLNSQLQERQKSETNELKQLRDRLEKLQKEIDERLQNREGVIDRRLEQLLSAKTAAGANPAAQQGTPILAGVPSTSTTGTTSPQGKSDFVPSQPSGLTIDGNGAVTPAPVVPNAFSDHDEGPQPKK